MCCVKGRVYPFREYLSGSYFAPDTENDTLVNTAINSIIASREYLVVN